MLKFENIKVKQKEVVQYLARIEKELPRLEVLCVEGCKLKVIPAEVSLLKKLRVLVVANNSVEALPDGLAQLERLRELSLADNQLAEFPVALLALQHIAVLNLKRNRVTTVPHLGSQTLEKLHLRKLNMKGNNLQSLPKEVCSIQSLRVLNMSYCGIPTLLDDIGKLDNLRELRLSGNKLASLPGSIGKIKMLRILDVSHNGLSQFPDEIGNLKLLRELYTHHNKIVAFPVVLTAMKLKILNLASNQIVSVPSEIGKLSSLIELRIQHNEIKTLPAEIKHLKLLRKLYLEFNKIERLPIELGELPKLFHLRLHQNQISLLPSALSNHHFLGHLLMLSIDMNPLDETVLKEIRQNGAIPFLLQHSKTTEPEISIEQRTIPVFSRKNSTKRATLEPSVVTTSTSPSPSVQRSPSKKNIRAMRRKSSQDMRSMLEFPPFSRFKYAWDILMIEGSFPDNLKEELEAWPVERKWRLLQQYKSTTFSGLLREDSSNEGETKGNSLGSMRKLSIRLSLSKKSPLLPPSQDIALSIKKRSSTMLLDIDATLQVLQSTPSWAAGFVEYRGLKHLSTFISEVACKKNPSEDEISQCNTSIASLNQLFEIDLITFLNSPNPVSCLVVAVSSNVNSIKKAALDMLNKISDISATGHSLIIDAFEHTYKAKKEPIRFYQLFRPLEMSFEQANMNLKIRCLSLINSIVSNTEDLVMRNSMRNDFLHLGMQKVLTALKKSTNNKEILQQVELFEEDMEYDYEDLVDFVQSDPSAFSAIFKKMKDIKKYVEYHEDSSAHDVSESETEDEEPQKAKKLLKESSSDSANILQVMVINHQGSMSVGFDKTTLVKDIIDQILARYGIEDPEEYGLYLQNKTPTRRSSFSSDPEFKFQKSVSEGTIKTLNPLMRKEGSENLTPSTQQAPSDTLLDPESLLFDCNILGQTVCEFKMKPWTVKVNASVGAVSSSGSFNVNPNNTCDQVLKQLMRRLPETTEDYGIFIAIGEGQEEGAVLSNGLWAKESDKLYQYREPIKQAKFQLQVKLKPIRLNVCLAGSGATQHMLFEADKLISEITQALAKQLLNDTVDEVQYGLHIERKDGSSFLDEQSKLQDCHISNEDIIQLKLKPRKFKMILPTDSQELQQAIDITKTAESIISFYCSQVHLNPLDYSLLLLDPERKVEPKVLHPLQTLHSHQLPANCTLIITKSSMTTVQDTLNVHIWDEERKGNILFEGQEIISATLNQLVITLTSAEDYDPDFMATFLLTYLSFTTPEDLFKKLRERYQVPVVVDDKTKSTIKQRICVFVKHWMEKCYHDLHSVSVLSMINEFIATDVEESWKGALTKIIRESVEPKFESPKLDFSPSQRDLRNLNRLSWNSLQDLEWAQHLTLQTAEVYRTLKPVEFFNQAWNSPQSQHLAPNVLMLIQKFNIVSKWVASCVLQETKLRNRVKLLHRFIKIAHHLREMNNFHILMSFVSGLNNAAIIRLKFTYEKLPRSSKQMWKELEELMQITGSFKNYRTQLHDATPPCIPYLGVHFQDLVFIEDGNPDNLGHLINWRKCKFMSSIIKLIQYYQDSEQYTFQPPQKEEAMLFLASQPNFSDKELFEYSLRCEPRGAIRGNIE